VVKIPSFRKRNGLFEILSRKYGINKKKGEVLDEEEERRLF
jgi:hypothetical protein